MSFRVRGVGSLSVLVSCAALVAWGCSSNNDKKLVPTPADGGAGGEGGVFIPEGGAAGVVSAPSEAGQGGAAAAGAPGEGGAGGEAPLSCAPSGNVSFLTVQQTEQRVCRGALLIINFTATNTDDSFTCCGTSNVSPKYGVKISGAGDGDGGGNLALTVPTDAPLGTQSITLLCGGAVENTLDINVTNTALPVVTSVDTSIHAGQPINVTGTNLQNVTNVVLSPTSGTGNALFCTLTDDTHTSTSIQCTYDGIEPGTYTLFVQQAECGFAVSTPLVTVLPPT